MTTQEAPNHFRSIGFTLESDEFRSCLQRAQHSGTTIAAPHGAYIAWTPGDGPQLWLNIEKNDDTSVLRGVTPNFIGGARMRIVAEAFERSPTFPLEGEMVAWSEPAGETHGLYPFSVSIPDFDLVAERTLPFRTHIALCGFASDFAWWPDHHAYEDAIANDATRFGFPSFVPIGLFGDNAGRARSNALVNGTLQAFTRALNPATERPFVHARIATHGGDIDVVAAPDRVDGEPPVGAIVRCTCWLVARIVDA